jgi:predicted membrane-bound spermidine synthase
VVGGVAAIFFVSGAAALLFETLWFNRAGLAFGSSIWASSLVLASFMGGLALGNAWMARSGSKVRRPLRAYAGLELIIGASGFALVCLLPGVGAWLAPLLEPLAGAPMLLNACRLVIGFLLLMVPATAMGATLPLVVQSLAALDPSYGSILGRLYGWNTLGAVAGALAGEWFLIGRCGVTGTAALAMGLNAAAATGALLLERCFAAAATTSTAGAFAAHAPAAGDGATFLPPVRRCLAAAALSGAIMLALEVLWFRFLLYFVHSGSLILAMMLAVVLAGIGAGGVVAGVWLRRRADAHRYAGAVALLAGTANLALYRLFALVQAPQGASYVFEAAGVLRLAAVLMLPGSFASGVLFTLVGAALRGGTPTHARAAGLLALYNTAGAALGALLAGAAMLPLLGLERALFWSAALYGVVALLLSRPRSRRFLLPFACYAIALATFPAGWMRERYLQIPIRRWDPDRSMELVAVREGRSETLLYLRKSHAGEPEYYKMITNGLSMSGTSPFSRRYMKLFAWLPLALHPEPRRALLISYGVGSTAAALATPELQSIDVVDISRDILAMSDIIYPDPVAHPLRDPRVHVHVEDGRYFLQTCRERYDIITSEPPPPKVSKVVNLYTREYFQLSYDRLAEGGIHTYWLPVHNLSPEDTRAILCAYCDVFEDCTLWCGMGLEWVLMGTRRARGPASEESFTRQWRDPRARAELVALGIERPEQLGTLFLAAAPTLREWIGTTPPLTDDRPKRLSDAMVVPDSVAAFYRTWVRPERARRRFAASAFVQRLWPPQLLERTLAAFAFQSIVHEVAVRPGPRGTPERYFEDLHRILTDSPYETLALWHLGVNADILPIIDRRLAAGDSVATHARVLGLRALAARDYDGAAAHLGTLPETATDRSLQYCHLYALCMAGRPAEARRLAAESLVRRAADDGDRSFWKWAGRRLGVPAPAGVAVGAEAGGPAP